MALFAKILKQIFHHPCLKYRRIALGQILSDIFGLELHKPTNNFTNIADGFVLLFLLSFTWFVFTDAQCFYVKWI